MPVAAVFLAASLAHAAPGDLDTAFGNGGKVIVGFEGISNDVVLAMAQDGTGNTYLAGFSNVAGSLDFAVVKLDANGQLVPGFGSGGKALIDFGDSSIDRGRAIAIAGPYLYIAGDSNVAGSTDFAIAKLDLNGQLVNSFGDAGRKTIDIGNATIDYVFALAIDATGNIHVVGAGNVAVLANSDFAVVKLDPNGNLVTGFGNGGKALVDFGGQGDMAYAAVLDAAGNLYLSGTVRYNNGTTVDMGIAKLDATGNLVTGFGSGGKVSIDFGAIDAGNALARGGDGSLYLAGSAEGPPGHFNMAVAKLDRNGLPVAGFGTAGKKILDLPSATSSVVNGVVSDSDGNVYLAGSGSYAAPAFMDFTVAALDPQGNLRGAFGNGGVRRVDFAGNTDVGYAALLDNSGHLTLGGFAASELSSNDMAVARLLVTRADRVFVNGFDP
jgi:uncharacterized delta-60 repeat protein